MGLSELVFTKEMAAGIVGAVVSCALLILGGLSLYLNSEKRRQRVEIFSKLAAIPIWMADPKASELLSAIPIAFSKGGDDQVRIAYRNYQGALSPYHSNVWIQNGDGTQDQIQVQLFSDQTIFRRDLLRELAVASGWMSRRRAADFDFTSLAISLVPQGTIPPACSNSGIPQTKLMETPKI